jgi:hypothetical protein
MSFWSNISAVLGYDTSAPFYTDPATGQITQAKANADGEYILPTQANGEPVERIPDSDPRVKSSLISTYGYDPSYRTNEDDFRYAQGGAAVEVLNRETGQYETAVRDSVSGQTMPISMAQARGIPYEVSGGYQSGGGFFSDILGGVGEIGKVLGPLAAVAGGANFLGGLGAAGAGAGEAASGFSALGAEDALMGQGFNSLSPGMSAGTTGATSAAGGFGGGGSDGLASLATGNFDPMGAALTQPAAGGMGGATSGLIQQLANYTGLSTSAIERLGGAAISSLAGLAGAGMTSSAAREAANRLAGANQTAMQLQSKMYEDQVARQQPFYQAGINALPAYTKGVMPGGDLVKPFSMADYQADPGYGFRMSEGMKALDRSAASRGGLLSGATMKGAQRYGQDLASQEYQNAYNRYTGNQATQRNALAGLTGFAPTAAQQIGAAGTNYANTAGNLGINTATNYGNAELTGAAARQSAYGGAGGAFANALSPNPLSAYLNKQYGGMA